MYFGLGWCETEGLLVVGQGLFGLLVEGARLAEVKPQDGVFRVEGGRLLEVPLGFGEILDVDERDAEDIQGLEMPGVLLENALTERLGLRVVLLGKMAVGFFKEVLDRALVCLLHGSFRGHSRRASILCQNGDLWEFLHPIVFRESTGWFPFGRVGGAP